MFDIDETPSHSGQSYPSGGASDASGSGNIVKGGMIMEQREKCKEGSGVNCSVAPAYIKLSHFSLDGPE